MRSNPVVFPFTPFRNLKHLTFHDPFVADLTISIGELRELLAQNELARVRPTGATAADKILSLFLHDRIRFGSKKLIAPYRAFWKEQINYFIRRKIPIQLAILGFPGKAPVPLKTNRVLPDLGEVLALRRLRDIAHAMKRVYPPGALITAVTEGALGEYIGLSRQETKAYEAQLARLAARLGWDDCIAFIPLGDLRKMPGFRAVFKRTLTEINQKLKNRDPEMQKKYHLAYPSVFHLMNVRRESLKTIAEVYRGAARTNAGKRLARRLIRKTDAALKNYFAFLKTRDELRFLERRIPHCLLLTVSPKPYRLGIQLSRSNLLAHHGVGTPAGTMYLIDIRRSQTPVTRLFLKEDGERKPFAYLPANRIQGTFASLFRKR